MRKKASYFVKICLLSMLLMLFIPFVSSAPSGGIAYYNFSSLTDLWGSNDGSCSSCPSSVLTYPSFNISGDSSPNSYDFSTDSVSFSSWGSVKSFSLWFNPDTTFVVETTSGQPLIEFNGPNYALWLGKGSGYLTNEIISLFSNGKYFYWSNSDLGITDLNSGSWYNIIIIWNASESNYNLYFDGEAIGLGTDYGGASELPFTSPVVGKRNTAYFNGRMDELKFYDFSLTEQQAFNIYNTGSYSAGSVPDNFSIYFTDFWNSTDLNNVWAYIDSVNYTNATGNKVTTHLLQNDTNNFNIRVGSSSHLSKDYNSQSVNLDLNVALYGTDIKFQGVSLNGSVIPLNITIEGTTKENDTSFYLDIDDILAEASSSSYYPLNYTFNTTGKQNETLNITGFYTTKFNVSPRDILNNNTIENATITLYSSDFSWNKTISGVYDGVFNVTSGNYTLNISAPDRVDYSENIVVTNSTNYTYYAYMYAYNSLWVYAFKQSDSSSIQSFNVSVSNANNSYSSTGSSGVAYINNISSGVYDVVVSADSYASGSYSVTMTDNSHQVLNAYLSSASTTDFIFLVKDKNTNDVLENALIVQRRFVNGTLTTIESKFTDITGRVQFNYASGVEYTFIASLSNYVTRTFLLEILFDDYQLYLTPELVNNPDVFTDDVVVSVDDYSFVNGSSYFDVSFVSPLGSLEYYYVNASFDNGSYKDLSGVSSSGSVFNLTFSSPVVSFGDSVLITLTYKSTLNSGEKSSSKVYLFSAWDDTDGGIESFNDAVDGYSPIEKVFWATIIIFSLASLFSVFGFASGEYFIFASIGAIVGIVASGLLGLINWVVSGLVIFFLIIFVIGRLINNG